MAKFYVDHDAYQTAFGMRYGSIPSLANWGIPQEGDGSSKYAATAASVGSITLEVAGAAANTLIVCGITFTLQVAARTAGTAQVTIGASAVATCNNIVAAFNDCSTAVAAGVAIGLPRFSNLIYARGPAVRGDSVARVDLMMRIGSATLNNSVNTNVGMSFAGGWATNPTITQFDGGIGGCWGTILNEAVMHSGTYSYAINTYGIGCATQTWKPLVSVSNLNLNTQVYPTALDYVWWRSRGGYSINLTAQAPGFSRTFSYNMMFDSNTEWTEDSGTGEMTFKVTANSSTPTTYFAGQSQLMTLGSVKQHALRFVTDSVTGNSGDWQFALGNSSGTQVGLFNLYFGNARDYGSLGMAVVRIRFTAGGYSTATISNCKFDYISRLTNSFPGLMGTSISDVTFSECDFYQNWASVTDPGPIYGGVLSSSMSMAFRNCSFRGAPSTQGSAYRGFNVDPAVSGGMIVYENCTGIKLDSYMGFQSARTDKDLNVPMVFVSSADTANGDRWESTNGVCDWNPKSPIPYPILSSTQPNGTPWSAKIDWMNYTGSNSGTSHALPYVSPEIMMTYRDTEAIRTITLEVFVPTLLDMNVFNSGIRISYVDSTDTLRSDTTKFKPTTFTTSTAVWSNAASWPTHSAKKYQLTTEYPVKLGSIIVVSMCLFSQSPSGAAEQVFFDPEFRIE